MGNVLWGLRHEIWYGVINHHGVCWIWIRFLKWGISNEIDSLLIHLRFRLNFGQNSRSNRRFLIWHHLHLRWVFSYTNWELNSWFSHFNDIFNFLFFFILKTNAYFAWDNVSWIDYFYFSLFLLLSFLVFRPCHLWWDVHILIILKSFFSFFLLVILRYNNIWCNVVKFLSYVCFIWEFGLFEFIL